MLDGCQDCLLWMSETGQPVEQVGDKRHLFLIELMDSLVTKLLYFLLFTLASFTVQIASNLLQICLPVRKFA